MKKSLLIKLLIPLILIIIAIFLVFVFKETLFESETKTPEIVDDGSSEEVIDKEENIDDMVYKKLNYINYNDKIMLFDNKYIVDFNGNIIYKSPDKNIVEYGYDGYFITKDNNVRRYGNETKLVFEDELVSTYHDENTDSLFLYSPKEDVNIIVYNNDDFVLAYKYFDDSNFTLINKYSLTSGKLLDSKKFEGYVFDSQPSVSFIVGKKFEENLYNYKIMSKNFLYVEANFEICNTCGNDYYYNIIDAKTLDFILYEYGADIRNQYYYNDNIYLWYIADEGYRLLKLNGDKYEFVEPPHSLYYSSLSFQGMSTFINDGLLLVVDENKNQGIINLDNEIVLKTDDYSAIDTSKDYISYIKDDTLFVMKDNNIVLEKNNLQLSDNIDISISNYNDIVNVSYGDISGLDVLTGKSILFNSTKKIEKTEIWNGDFIESVKNNGETFVIYRNTESTDELNEYEIYDNDLNLLSRFKSESMHDIKNINDEYFEVEINEQVVYLNINTGKIENAVNFTEIYQYGSNNLLNDKFIVILNDNKLNIYTKEKELVTSIDGKAITWLNDDNYLILNNNNEYEFIKI